MREILLGIVGPLMVAGVTWVAMERMYRRNPARLTRLMVGAFAGKVVFFGVYVVVMLSVLSLRPVPFMISFTGAFIAFHLTEAVCLRRLLAGR